MDRREETINLKIQSHRPGVLSSGIAKNGGRAGASEMEGEEEEGRGEGEGRGGGEGSFQSVRN